MDILRLVTIHPILVHATLGGIPLMLLACAGSAKAIDALALRHGSWATTAAWGRNVSPDHRDTDACCSKATSTSTVMAWSTPIMQAIEPAWP